METFVGGGGAHLGFKKAGFKYANECSTTELNTLYRAVIGYESGEFL